MWQPQRPQKSPGSEKRVRTVGIMLGWSVGLDITICLGTAAAAVCCARTCPAVYARRYNAVGCFPPFHFCHLIYTGILSGLRWCMQAAKEEEYFVSCQSTDLSLGVSSGSRSVNL